MTPTDRSRPPVTVANAPYRDVPRGLLEFAKDNPYEAGLLAASMSGAEPVATIADGLLTIKETKDAYDKEGLWPAIKTGALGAALTALPFVGMGAVKAVRGGADLPMDEALLAHTNIRPSGLEVADEIGGIPMPSLAISRVDHPMTNFGDITLLADKNMAMPSRNTNVWANDAYTGRQPRGVVDFVDRKAAMQRFADDPRFSHLSDKSYAFDMFDDFEGADRALRQINLAVEKGLVDPKKFESFQDLRSASRSAVGYGAADASNVKGLSSYGETHRLLPQGFTDYGNRRRPKPYTLENVMREMKRDGAGLAQSEGFHYGPGSFRAAVSPRLTSAAEVKSSRGRIVSPEEAKRVKDAFDEKYTDLVSRVAEASGRKGFQAMDSAAGYMEDLIKRRDVSWFEDVGDGLKGEIRDLADEAAKMPTEYFEAKPRRAVGLNEFSGAIVPSKITPETEAILKKHGIERVFKYGSDEERVGLLKKFPDLMFSIAGAGLLGVGARAAMPSEDERGLLY